MTLEIPPINQMFFYEIELFDLLKKSVKSTLVHVLIEIKKKNKEIKGLSITQQRQDQHMVFP
jgi:hypothetical protein